MNSVVAKIIFGLVTVSAIGIGIAVVIPGEAIKQPEVLVDEDVVRGYGRSAFIPSPTPTFISEAYESSGLFSGNTALQFPAATFTPTPTPTATPEPTWTPIIIYPTWTPEPVEPDPPVSGDWQSIVCSYAWSCEEALYVIYHESRGDMWAINPSSGACGLWQHYPCIHYGDNWAQTEAAWLKYIACGGGSFECAWYRWWN